MAAVAGLRGTGDWATDERPKNFREYILFRNPNGTAPLTALMGKAKSEATDDAEFSWWDEANDIVRLQANGEHLAAVTTITVDSSDPSASSPGLSWGTAQHLVPGDVLLVEKTETATYNNELLLVTSVISATQFTVQRGFAGTTAATITDDSYILKIGSAYSEGSASPDASTRNPTKFYNFCQIFKTAFEITESAKRTRTRTGDPLKNDKKRKMFDHSRDIEHALMFGVRSESTGANGKPLRTSGGLRYFIPAANQTVFTTAVTTTALLDAVYPVFDYDTEAGDERIAFCGNQFLNELNKICAAAGTVQFTEVVKLYGMNLRKYVMPQGTLYLRTHPLMNRNTKYTKSAFIIDPTSLIWRHLRDTKSQPNIQGNDEDTEKGQWLTEAGLEIRYAGLTCAYLGNMSAT